MLACAAVSLLAVLPSVHASRAWTTEPCPDKGSNDEAPGLICEGLSEAQLCSQEGVELVETGNQKCVATLDRAGRTNKNISSPCSVGDVGEFPPFVPDRALQQDSVSQYAYFDSRRKECVQYAVNEKVGPGCAPFATLHSCTYHCRDYSENKLEEVEKELEEEGVEIGLFLFHTTIMLYMCFGLALVCEDFFVAALEIIIDKLKLPPDVAGASRVPWRCGYAAELTLATLSCRSDLYGSRIFISGKDHAPKLQCAV
jgi:hypothetical protein